MQRPIDLLPDSIRARGQAGVITGRYIVSVVIAVGMLTLSATHSRLILDLARERLTLEEKEANKVLAAEAKGHRLRSQLKEMRDFVVRYEQIALPLDLSRVMATIINLLPESASLDRLDAYAGPSSGGRSSRSRGRGEEGPRPRSMTGELSGFARTDLDVAELVTALESLDLFEHVSLDFSRTRTVRGLPAREFRISFRADLDTQYTVMDWDAAAATGERGHVE